MKTKVVVGLVLAAFGIGVLLFLFYPVPAFILAFFTGAAAYEMQRVSGQKSKAISVLSIAVAALTPIFIEYKILERLEIPYYAVVAALTIIMLILMLAKFESTRFEQVLISLFSATILPCAFSTLLLIRNLSADYPSHFSKPHSVYLVLVALVCAWLTDAFAYFIGMKFGKRKLAPKISPKKSVEGAVGGIAVTAVVNLIMFFVFNHFYFGDSVTLKYWMVIILSVFLSIMGICGDLSASVIKRNYGQKDFGTIMPGHGGIMDRFDSYLFVTPVLYGIIEISMRLFS